MFRLLFFDSDRPGVTGRRLHFDDMEARRENSTKPRRLFKKTTFLCVFILGWRVECAEAQQKLLPFSFFKNTLGEKNVFSEDGLRPVLTVGWRRVKLIRQSSVFITYLRHCSS